MIAAILKEHFRYGNREPEMCGCGIYKPWARFSEEYEHPVAEETWEEHVAEVIREAIAQEIEASKATQRVATDHEPRWSAGACKCGAPLGDGIDLHWHMVNQTIDHAARIARGGTP